MDDLAIKEQKKYTTLWGQSSDYRESSPADSLTPLFLLVFKDQLKKGERVIDFGCGAGRSATILSKDELRVDLIDFCDNCIDMAIFFQTLEPQSTIRFFQECLWDLSQRIEPSEWIICFDVLEHIPEEKVESVLEAMSSRMQKGGLVSISLREDYCGASIGEVLHVTVKPAYWWREKITPYFSIFHEFDFHETVLLLALKPKHDSVKNS